MISVEGVWKAYTLPDGRKRQVYSDLWLKLPSKTNIGIIGRNGTGKSTLVRLLSGAELPDRGRVVSDGHISPPIGLQAGLSAWLSGRDNVRFVCRILGDLPEVMARRVEFVREFSELEDYFEHPVKTYSSGMRARLSFALSMAFSHDYYLIDELTSVGDAKFHQRVKAVFDAKRATAGILLVSHNMDTLREWCDAGVYVQRGKVEYFDNIRHAIDAYLRDNS